MTELGRQLPAIGDRVWKHVCGTPKTHPSVWTFPGVVVALTIDDEAFVIKRWLARGRYHYEVLHRIDWSVMGEILLWAPRGKVMAEATVWQKQLDGAYAEVEHTCCPKEDP